MVHSAWEAAVGSGPAAKQGAGGVQRHAHDEEQDQNDEDGLEGHGQGGPVYDRGGVDDREADEDDTRHKETLVHHGSLPMLSAKHPEDSATLIAPRNDSCQIRDDEG